MNLPAEKSYRQLFWSVAMIGLVLDQASKYMVFNELYSARPESKRQLIAGAFELLTRFTNEPETGQGLLSWLRALNGDKLPFVNTGALFGWGTGWGWDANSFFALVSVAAALAIIYWSTRPQARHDRFLALALGLILAGTLGNLYDRVVFGGVRDFLHWYYLIDWPVFNLADCCLVCGAALLLLQAFVTEPAVQEPLARAAESPSAANPAEVVEMKWVQLSILPVVFCPLPAKGAVFER